MEGKTALSPYLTKFEKSRVPYPPSPPLVATYHLTQEEGEDKEKGKDGAAWHRNSAGIRKEIRARGLLLLARLSRNGALGLAIRRVVIQATFRVKRYLTLPLTLSLFLSLFSLCERFEASFISFFFFYPSIFLPSFDSPEETRVKEGSSNYRRGSSLQITGNFVLFEV